MIYLLTGPAGVGKSTISKIIASKLEKSALIEGDDVYHQVVGSYVAPWKDGNHMELFWKLVVENIKIYSNEGYDVVFNYIITPNELEMIKERLDGLDIKFILLLTKEDELIKRDLERSEDCRMNERCIVLLNKFKSYDYGKDYQIDTTNLEKEVIVNKIIVSNDYLIK